MGGRLSMMMGLSATLVSLAVGVPVGLAAGYFRGWIDEVLMRCADVLMAVPPIMLGLLVLAVTPPSLWKTALAVGFVYIPPIARLTRSVTLSLANEDFIQAARARAETTSAAARASVLKGRVTFSPASEPPRKPSTKAEKRSGTTLKAR